MSRPTARSSSTASSSSRAIDDQLQVASAWLPGRVAAAHVSKIASHLIGAVAGLAKSCGMMSDAAASLTAQLGAAR